NYEIEFSAPNMQTQKVKLNTTVPKDAIEEGLMPFFFDVYLFKAIDGYKGETATITFNQTEYAFFVAQEHLRTLKSQQTKVAEVKNITSEELAKREAEEKARLEAEAKAKAEMEEKARKEAEEKARLE